MGRDFLRGVGGATASTALASLFPIAAATGLNAWTATILDSCCATPVAAIRRTIFNASANCRRKEARYGRQGFVQIFPT